MYCYRYTKLKVKSIAYVMAIDVDNNELALELIIEAYVNIHKAKI